jgi:tetraacyldisaccharide 4'-kinase
MKRWNAAEWHNRFRPALAPIGRGYGWAMRWREAAYRRGWLETWRPPAPCISVGNINWGGSGKTPLCASLLRHSVNGGQLPALLSRGYKARPAELPYLVQPDSPVEDSGDEPLMLARQCPGALIVVDPSRRRAGRWIYARRQPDLFVLDDAFQHLAVSRDVDLVILTPEDLTRNWNAPLPGGTWREGRQALKRASAVLIQADPDGFLALGDRLRMRLAPLGIPIFSFVLLSRGVRHVSTGRSLDGLDGEYMLISGVGSPERVAGTAERLLGRKPLKHWAYPDHYAFNQSDWHRIKHRARALGCRAVLCTPKDSVKLERWADERLYTFELDLELGPSLQADTDLWTWLDGRLRQG